MGANDELGWNDSKVIWMDTRETQEKKGGGGGEGYTIGKVK